MKWGMSDITVLKLQRHAPCLDNNPRYTTPRRAPNETSFPFMSDLSAESIQQSNFLIAERNNSM